MHRAGCRRLPLLLCLLVGLAAASPAGAAAKRSNDTTTWLCRPGLASNPCTPGLSTTRFSPSGAELGVEPVRAQRKPPVDCFYVYPTVSDQPTPQANLTIDPEERSIALYQAARYSQVCRVFAPVYRQFTLAALGTASFKIDGSTALADVRSAFRAYMTHYNKGRGVVLIGHSQGSFMLRALIAKDVDPSRAMRRRLVSAILLGGDVEVRRGSGVGGDFRHVAACRSGRQIGCVIAFSTFDTPPLPNSKFGLSANPAREILCTNPAALAGGSGTLDTIFPSAPFAPGTAIALGIKLLGVTLPSAPTTFIHVPRAYTAQCSGAGGAHVLQVTPLDGAPNFKPSPDATWGLHLVDANIALGNLVALVRAQGAVWTSRYIPHRDR